MKLLFVCTGNTCRSVLAHQWALKLAGEKGLDWEVRSAGIAADPFFPVADEVRKALSSSGAAGDFQHTPSRFSQEHADWADLIFVMEDIQKLCIEKGFPGTAKKTHLLRVFAGLQDPKEVKDPIGGPVEVYQKALDSIREALEAIENKLSAVSYQQSAKATAKQAGSNQQSAETTAKQAISCQQSAETTAKQASGDLPSTKP